MTVDPKQRGAALLTVILLVAVIAVLAATALERLRLSTRLAANAVALDRARGFAYAAETLATTRVTALLRQAGKKVTLAGGWSGRPFGLPIPGGAAAARITDGGDCFNLNGLVTRAPDGSHVADPASVAQFARLIAALRLNVRAEAIAAAAADWIDSDDTALPAGAEDGDYRSERPARRTGATLMADASELAAVKGVTPPVWAALRPWVCALPEAKRSVLNLNTLSPEQAPLVAMLLPDGTSPAAIQSVLLRRPPTGWGSTDEFWNALSRAGVPATTGEGRQQTGGDTRWFALRIDVVQGATELHETALIDARALPVRLVARQWGDAP